MRLVLSTFGTAGDLVPFARLARELVGRGHRVTVHAWAHHRTWFPDEVDFTAAAGGVDGAEMAQTMRWALEAKSPLEQMRRFCRLFYGLGLDDGGARGAAYVAGCREAFAGHDVAVLNVLDHLGQAVAEDMGLRWACVTSRPPPDPAQADPLFAPVDEAISALVQSLMGGPRRRVRLFRQESPWLTLVGCSPALVGPGPNVTGAWLDPPAAVALPDAVEAALAAGPCLLVTFGALPEVNRRTELVSEAITASGWRAIVQSPGERLPFSALLPRVAAVVHHGGAGTTHEIARAGKPSFAVPHMADQFYWASVVHARGLGPPPLRFTDLALEPLVARLEALRGPDLAARAAAMAPLLATERGVAEATDRIART